MNDTSELTLSEALKAAKAWQENAQIAIPAEVITGLVDGVAELRQAFEDVRIFLLPDSYKSMTPSLASITRAKERIRAALALVDGLTEKETK